MARKKQNDIAPFISTHFVYMEEKMNINKRIAMAALMFFMIPLCSCSTATLMKMVTDDLGAYDKTIPENRSATLTILRGYTVTRFDGGPVQWQASSLTAALAEIRVPAGQHEIEYSYHREAGGGCSPPTQEIQGNRRVWVEKCTPRYDEKRFDRKVTVNFEAGKQYYVNEHTISSGTQPFHP
jgi:hypothetical protein